MMNLISLVALPVFVLSLLVLAFRGDLISLVPGVVVCQISGLALMVWARVTFPRGSFRVTAKPAGSTVLQTGPYRFVRHPIYAGALLLLWATIAGHPSIVNVGIGSVASLLTIGKIIVEEHWLRLTCPGYAQYAQSTKALIPFVL